MAADNGLSGRRAASGRWGGDFPTALLSCVMWHVFLTRPDPHPERLFLLSTRPSPRAPLLIINATLTQSASYYYQPGPNPDATLTLIMLPSLPRPMTSDRSTNGGRLWMLSASRMLFFTCTLSSTSYSPHNTRLHPCLAPILILECSEEAMAELELLTALENPLIKQAVTVIVEDAAATLTSAATPHAEA